MFARPLLDLARISIRPAVAVRAIAIALLQELLILPFELTLHDDVPHVRAAFAKLAGGVPIGVVDARVVRQLATVHAVAVPVAALIVPVTSVHLQELAASIREHDAAVTLIERYGRDKAFIAQVVEAVGARVVRLPPYSPDFNPIEMAISKVKTVLRKLAQRSVDGLFTGIGDALGSIRAADALNYIAHCGYATKRRNLL